MTACAAAAATGRQPQMVARAIGFEPLAPLPRLTGRTNNPGQTLSRGVLMRPSKLTAVIAVISVVGASAVIQTASGVTLAPPPAHHLYVTIQGKQGPFKNDAGVTGAIEAMKLSYGVTAVIMSMAGPSGPVTAASGERNYVPVHFSKFLGFASGELLNSMIHHEVLSLVQIDFVRDMGPTTQQMIARIELTNAWVVGIQSTSQADAAGVALVPLEDIALVAQTFKLTYVAPSVPGVTAVTQIQALDPNSHFVP